MGPRYLKLQLQGTHLHPLVSETDPVGLGFANLPIKNERPGTPSVLFF